MDVKFSAEDLDYFLGPQVIRDRANAMLADALEGKTNFKVCRDKIPAAAKRVINVMASRYPEGDIPVHSRWGHFNTEKKNRESEFLSKISQMDQLEQARCEIDLIITSVLLDAGAGKTWSFLDPETEENIGRSEGLALASYHMFVQGGFSSDSGLNAHAEKLMALTKSDLEQYFQVSESNKLEGVDGRVGLLNSLGTCILNNKKFFSTPRPGALVDYLHQNSNDGEIEAETILRTLLVSIGSIWPGRYSLGKQNLGDTWEYSPWKSKGELSSLVCFHKLSQWLTYSLMETLQRSGLKVTKLEKLTALAEYRNGGFLVDSGILELRSPDLQFEAHGPGSNLVIEWRSLTIALIEELASAIRKELGVDQIEMPLPKILEGGTWWAGRIIAKELRKNGAPPIEIISDGTVF